MEAPSIIKQRMQEQTPLSSTMFGSKFNTVSRTTAYPACRLKVAPRKFVCLLHACKRTLLHSNELLSNNVE